MRPRIRQVEYTDYEPGGHHCDSTGGNKHVNEKADDQPAERNATDPGIARDQAAPGRAGVVHSETKCRVFQQYNDGNQSCQRKAVVATCLRGINQMGYANRGRGKHDSRPDAAHEITHRVTPYYFSGVSLANPVQ